MSFKYPRFIAHRGASGSAPENTLKAFREAKRLGASMVEFDVGLCADEVAVVIHDDTVDRTTNGHGNVLALTLAELRALDAGEGERIPTLGEVLACLVELNLAANIEIKPCRGLEKRTVSTVLADIARWQAKLPAIVISSFSNVVLNEVRRQSDQSLLAALFEALPEGWEKQIVHLNCISVNLNKAHINAQKIQLIKSKGYQVLCYTAETSREAEPCFEMGVDAVFVNNI
ncbi:MAG: glycerophosphodiester phosphodiesterase [Legionellaceae bacterium]|nr:glycerophosphodiester phosphodiesterase [Legionellaceae bacterium]